MSRQPILLTGFGPFPGAPENVSKWLVEALADTISPRLGWAVAFTARCSPPNGPRSPGGAPISSTVTSLGSFCISA